MRIHCAALALSLLGIIVACGPPGSSEDGAAPEAAVGADASVAAPGVPGVPGDDASSPDAQVVVSRVPDRLVVITFPHGARRADWVPTAPTGTCTLSKLVQPFAKHQAKVSVIDGLDLVNGAQALNASFEAGTVSAVLTGAVQNAGTPSEGPYVATKPSLDAVLASSKMGDNVRFRSVQLGVAPVYTTAATLSWAGVGQPLPNETSPARAVQRLFLSDPPDVGAPSGAPSNANFLENLRAQLKVVEAAFTRDVTRIATLQICSGACFVSLPGLPAPYTNTAYQSLAHQGPPYDAGLTLAQLLFMNEIAASVDRLAATPTEDGRTLLDHTLILVTTDGGEPLQHTTKDVFTLLIGDLHGTMKPSLCGPVEDRGNIDLLRTIAKLFGESPDTVAPPSRGTGLITNLIVP